MTLFPATLLGDCGFYSRDRLSFRGRSQFPSAIRSPQLTHSNELMKSTPSNRWMRKCTYGGARRHHEVVMFVN